MSVWRRVGAFLGQIVIVTLVTVGLVESLVAVSFRYPSASPLPRGVLRQMHVLFDRNTIQVMPECAVYDATLTYTLRPGKCTFANREFSTEVAVNSLGVRDDEASLRAPGIVVLGDSLAMGWGVADGESFPAVIERLSGRRTLNAGVSSYGTVRELRMFERIDRQVVSDVVIQYSGNDLVENEQLVAGRFRTLSQEQYERTVSSQAEMLSYHPGKHAVNLFVMLRNLARERQAPPVAASADHEAKTFLDVVAKSPVDLTPFAVTVLCFDSAFANAARAQAAASGDAVLQRLRFLDATPVSAIPNAYFVLDDHPTRIGQEAIGRMVAEALAGRSAS